jgi:hypothetical protein
MAASSIKLPLRAISSKDATLVGLAESPHLTVCLSEDELRQARAVEEAALRPGEVIWFDTIVGKVYVAPSMWWVSHGC